MAASSSKVFAIVELLDLILKYLSDEDVAAQLTRLQRINSTWRDLIQRHFATEDFLEPVGEKRCLIWDQGPKDPNFLYIRDNVRPLWGILGYEAELCVPLLRIHPLLSSRSLEDDTTPGWCNPDLSKLQVKTDDGMRDGPRAGNGSSLRLFHRLNNLKLIDLPRKGDWEKTFISQPPIHMLRLRFFVGETETEDAYFRGSQILVTWQNPPEGITLGGLRDVIDRELWRKLGRKPRTHRYRKPRMAVKNLDLILFDNLIVVQA